MSNLTERAAFLKGMAKGMDLKPDTQINSLLLEMLDVIGEMAQSMEDMDSDIAELNDFVEDMDSDLSEVENVIFDDEEDEEECDGNCDCCDMDCCGEDADEELSFECPNCGKEVVINAADIDGDESPVCKFCGEPFFTDIEEDDEEPEA